MTSTTHLGATRRSIRAHEVELEPTEQQRARIEACRNRRQLERWLQKALWANEVVEIFGR